MITVVSIVIATFTRIVIAISNIIAIIAVIALRMFICSMAHRSHVTVLCNEALSVPLLLWVQSIVFVCFFVFVIRPCGF